MRGLHVLLTLSALAIGACVLDRTGTNPDASGAGGSTSTATLITTGSTSTGPTGSASGPTTTGSTSSAGGATTTTTTTTSTTTSSTTSGGAEDCSNGADDNANQLIDCDDPGCSGQVELPFMPGVPYGTLDAASCPSGKVSAGDACAADCSCTVAPGFCGATVQIYDTSSCNAAGLKYNNPHGQGCHAMGISAASGNLGYVAFPGEFQQASCMPGNASAQAHSFCEATVSSYTNKKGKTVVCAPPELTCIQLPGDQACPGGYTARQEKISAPGCACGCTASQDCSGEQVSLCDSNCNNCGGNIKLDNKCHDAGVSSLGNIFWAQPQNAFATCMSTPPAVQFTVCCAK